MSKEDRLAQEIINAVGGMRNIQRIMHCMTRVRLSIKNPDIVNYDELHQIEGVIGIVEDETLQIIVGRVVESSRTYGRLQPCTVR